MYKVTVTRKESHQEYKYVIDWAYLAAYHPTILLLKMGGEEQYRIPMTQDIVDVHIEESDY